MGNIGLVEKVSDAAAVEGRGSSIMPEQGQTMRKLTTGVVDERSREINPAGTSGERRARIGSPRGWLIELARGVSGS